MVSILLGALGAILVFSVFAAGVYVGRKSLKSDGPVIRAETPAEAETRRLVEDQNAFKTLLGYGPEMAYGRYSAKDITGSKDGDS